MRLLFVLMLAAGAATGAHGAPALADAAPYAGQGGPEEPLPLESITIEARRDARAARRSIAPDPRLARRYERAAPVRVLPLRLGF